MPRVTIGLLMLATAILLSQVLPVGTSEPLNFAVFAQPDPLPGLQVLSTYRDLADSLGIVVNRSNPVENLSLAELRKIFLGEQSHWSNGRRITVVMLEPGKQERQAVLTQIYRMDDKDFNKHFSQGVSTGEIHAAPKTLATSTEVLKFVLNVPGAIGYVRVTEADDSVKVVHVDSRLPGDKDYSIRLHPRPGKP
jgi:ABC-type phosphate transport system substrate-binding protein